MMLPGSDCMECHDGGEGPRWTVAGTWQRRGQQVRIQDVNGKTFTVHTNQAGNFYTAEKLAFPLQAACVNKDGRRDCMDPPVPYGGCNGCHTQPPQNDAPGRIALPAPGETP